ncbi:hypothetical protein [Nocardia aurea]|uniref:hypothetical protein n=1 Tax=Nocardia aurea TaxID=2144174 RepID=UPI000D69C574|nr:hypothetical protein [Nocardia aurea]
MPFVIVGGTIPFVPTSMNKNGNHQFPIVSGPTNWWVVPNWTADSTYPGSVVIGNGLQVSTDKIAATITANLPFAGGFSGTTKQQARLLVDGTVVGTGTQVTGVSGVLTVSAAADVLAGSIITVETNTDVTVQSWAASITATGSYVRIT